MALQQDILNLLLKLKDKNLSSKEKSKIKTQLKKLYSKIKKLSPKQVKITSPFKEEVKQALFPLQQSLITEKQKLKLFENSVKNEIKQLEEQRSLAVDPEELRKLSLMIKEKKEEIQLLKSNIKEGAPIEGAIQSIIEFRNIETKEEVKKYALNMIRRKIMNSGSLSEGELITDAKKPIGRALKKVLEKKSEEEGKKFNEAAYKRELDALVKDGFEKVKEIIKAEQEEMARRAEEEALRRAQEAEIRRQEEALRALERQAREAEKRQKAEEERQRLERKEAGAVPEPAIRKGFFAKREKGYPKTPVIVEAYLTRQQEINNNPDIDETEKEFQLLELKVGYAKEIIKLTPAEQKAIRNYTVSTVDRSINDLLEGTRDLITSTMGNIPAQQYAETINSLRTTDDQGDRLDLEQLGVKREDYIEGGKKKSNYNYMGKKAKKIQGGAGLADYMLTLGSIPGVPQLLNNFGPFGQVLGQASGLAQTFGKTAGQLAKEQSKEGEKVAGFTDSLGGLTKMFGFGKKKRGGKANMADMSGGAFSDFLGTIGKITPKIGGIVGAVPTYGKVATIGNSVLGSASRVGEDIFKMLGLGNMDTTLSGFGNIDLSNQKGYGRKGGRKMIPHDRPMPMLMNDMAFIQPYGLQAEAPQMLEGMGEEMTPYLKDIFPFGVPKFRGKGKKMKGGYLTSLFNVMGKGKNKKMKGGFLPLLALLGTGDNMKGCGKIGGEYVSSEFEDEYLNNLANILNQKQMAVLQGERQFEQQIQKQMNMEQQNALSQLQYYDLLNKIQQPRPQF
jgi:hypothetical protein